ncbi:MAG: hypothetical protein IJS03_06670 [Eubacterium sp.]|nr:hypothetical protein [Eubacterium sp.]
MSDEIRDQLDENEKIVTDNDEINEVNKSVLGQLDSPLVVHKKGDASYEESSASIEMNETHTDEERPTLKRHRYRKEKKGHGRAVFVIFIIAILLAVGAALYLTGNLSFGVKNNTTTKKVTTTEATTSIEEKFKNTIVVKGVYIFVDGEEVDGIEGLQDALEYEDKSTTRYEIIDENANEKFLNYEVLAILEQMGFYDKNTEITHVANTGLMAKAEITTTTKPTTTTTTTKKATTTAASSEGNKSENE